MDSFIPHKNKKHTWRTITFIFFVLCFSATAAYSVQAYPQVLNTSALIQKVVSVGPTEQITIDFSFPVKPLEVERSINIIPKEEVEFVWEKGNKKLNIIPRKYWKPESKYVIEISRGENVLLLHFDEKLQFFTKPYPAIAKTVPLSGTKDVSVAFEDPIMFNFDRPLDDYDLKFEINPQKQLEFQLSDDKKTARLLSKEDLAWNTQYAVSVSIKLKKQSDNEYSKLGEVSFTTAFPPPPLERSKDPVKRLEEAMLYTKPQILTGKYIDISLEYQNMIIFENGKALNAYTISSGKRGMETPQGTFAIHNKTPRAWSKKYALFMPYWMAFLPSGQMGIHELPEWPVGYKEGANHLGIPVSHGCVRLGIGPAKRVYDWAEIGTPVIIHM
jgi:lipoprotein-anchoring transpeptidase ErfK/SrfK